MPILGIDDERCIKCQECIKDCPTQNFSLEENQEQIVFDGSRCIFCGHCIAICPEKAIQYEDMKMSHLNSKKVKILEQ